MLQGPDHGKVMVLFQWLFLCAGRAETVVDVVQRPSSQEDFPGLYCPALKANQLGFVGNHRILLGSVWRSSIQALL